MITVKSLNTPIAQYADLQDLARNFKPWGRVQDYWYTEANKFISWLVTAKEIQNVTKSN